MQSRPSDTTAGPQPTLPTERSFSAKDGDGEEHGYLYTLHPATEGWRLTATITAKVGRPIIAGLGPTLVAAFASASRAGLSMGQILHRIQGDPTILESVDFDKIADGLSAALTGLDDGTLQSVLRYVMRDGKPLVTGSGKFSEEFKVAYAGNYGELAQALWAVAMGNGFLPVAGIFSAETKRRAT